MTATAIPTQPTVEIPPPVTQGDQPGQVKVSPEATLEIQRRRFAEKFSIAESEAAMWQAAYEQLLAQRNQEVAQLLTRVRELEAAPATGEPDDDDSAD